MPFLKMTFACLLLMLSNAVVLSAQPEADVNKSRQNLDSIMDKVDNAIKSKSVKDTLIQMMNVIYKDDTFVTHAMRDYRLFGLKHRQRSLQWNMTSGIIIFWCVIVLVFSGISFAGVQFYKSLYHAKKMVNDTNTNLNTQFEANLQGFKINSPVLGVIILLISLMFFYLYLVYVYPITEIF